LPVLFFLFYCYRAPRDPPSFPTRRSSDLGGAPLRVDFGAEPFECLRLEIPERQLLELVLDLAHAEPVGDGGVDVARFFRDPHARSEEHTSELQSRVDLVCRLLLEKKKEDI